MILAANVAVDVVFWILAVAMAVAAIGVVRSQNVVHAALYLVVVLAGQRRAVHPAGGGVRRVGAGADLHRRRHHLVPVRHHAHAGADARRRGTLDNDQRWPAAVVALFLFGVLAALLVDAFGDKKIKLTTSSSRSADGHNIASSIFRNYLVPFEVVSMLLLAALVGAVVIARRD